MTGYKKVIVRPAAFTKVGPLSALSCAMLAACGGGVSSLTSPLSGSIPAALTRANSRAQKTQTFSYTGAQQNFTVPAGARHVTIFAIGASSKSAAGGSVSATIPVQPGEQLAIFVGGKPNGRKGGFNGGGDGGKDPPICGPCRRISAGGGGASDVREGGNALTNRVIVAGGGGGRGGSADIKFASDLGVGGRGGIGGGPAGSKGRRGGGTFYNSSDSSTYTGGGGGGGGTQKVGGVGGPAGYLFPDGPSGDTGAAGQIGTGGAGAVGAPYNGGSGGSGGGGGGGYYGGGGGGAASKGGGGGGGGGSSFAEASATAVKIVRGDGPSEVVISW